MQPPKSRNIAIRTESDVVSARAAARELAVAEGLRASDQAAIVTAVAHGNYKVQATSFASAAAVVAIASVFAEPRSARRGAVA